MRSTLTRFGAVAAGAALAVASTAGVAAASSHGPSTHHAPGKARGATTIVLDATTVGKLTTAGITAGALKPARLDAKTLTATFPIVGNMKRGTVSHVGGLSLSSSTTKVTLRNFIINTKTNTVSAFATVKGSGGARLTVFDLASAPAQTGCAVTAQLNVDAAAGAALAKAFPALGDVTGASVGVACVVPRTK